MTKAERHQRASEILREVFDLDPAEWSAYVDRACQGDEELRRQVETLLAHDSDRPVFEENVQSPPVDVSPPKRRTSDSVTGKALRILEWLIGTRMRSTILSGLLLAILFSLGLWTYRFVENSLLEIRAEELREVRDGNVLALSLWVDEQASHLEQLARDPRLPRIIDELLTNNETEGEGKRARLPVARDSLAQIFGSYSAEIFEGGVGILNPLGELITEPSNVLSPVGFSYLANALAGETVFIRPHRLEDILPNDSGTMYVYWLTPVRDQNDRVIAILGGLQRAYNQFSEILGVAQLGSTGETYAFDSEGVMLSESRFTKELRKLGVIPGADDLKPAWESGAQLNVLVRDPGGDLEQGHVPELDVYARPLTRIVALAAAAQKRRSPAEMEGVILEPYRNYRGVESVGAWQWLPDLGFGVATEVEASEILSPIRRLRYAYVGIFGLMLLWAGIGLFSSASLFQLRRWVSRQRRLGPYELVEKIGEGGMGEVWLAKHDLLARPSAIKRLRPENLSDSSVRRFEREVRQASQLTHPNTVEIYDFGRSSTGDLYYVMEYLPGISLSDLVKLDGPQPAGRVVFILEQVCRSLQEAHQHGLIHRDIKPGNIIICERGGEFDFVKVLDFGLVKSFKSPHKHSLTSRLGLTGTIQYMSPERLEKSQDIDERSDIYSIGAVAYKLLTGKDAFTGSTEAVVLHKILIGEPARLSDFVEIPSAMEELVLQCLGKDPADRPVSAIALRQELENLDGLEPWTSAEAEVWWQKYMSRRMQ